MYKIFFMDEMMPVSEVRPLAKSLRALQSVLRLRILSRLAEGENNVKSLAMELRVSQPLISWHLTQLRQAGYVYAERVGREAHYFLQPDAFRELRQQLEALLGFPLC